MLPEEIDDFVKNCVEFDHIFDVFVELWVVLDGFGHFGARSNLLQNLFFGVVSDQLPILRHKELIKTLKIIKKC